MLETIRHLSSEIGSRQAGSPSETAAMGYLENQFTDLGYKSSRIPSHFHYSAFNHLFFTWIVLPLLAVIWLMDSRPLLGLLLPAWVYAAPDLLYRVLHLLPKTGTTQNLLVTSPAAVSQRIEVLVTAHVDTARSFPLHGRFWSGLNDQGYIIFQRLSLLIAAISVAVLLGTAFGPALWGVSRILLSTFCLLYLGIDLSYLFTKARFSPGANDNASGTAVLLEVARDLDPGLKDRCAFLLTSAEESGLFGARSCALHFRKEGITPAVLNLDMVGCGNELLHVVSAGIIAPIKTNPLLNSILLRIDPTLGRLKYDQRKSDFYEFQRLGFHTASLEASGTPEFWLAYHSVEDDIRWIDSEMLMKTYHLLRGWIQAILEDSVESGL